MDNDKFKEYVLRGINYDDYIDVFCNEFTTTFKRKAIDKILASIILKEEIEN